MEEFWSLTLFTVLAQAAAGMAILKGLCPKGESKKFSLWAFIAIVLLAIGTIVSTFHLNSPFRGYLALANPFGSWLSLEIYSVVLFGLTLVACFVSRAYIVHVISGVAGIFMVFVMSSVYMAVSNAASWESYNTPVNFYATTLLLGAVGLFTASLISREDKVAVLLGPLPKLIALFVVVRMAAMAVLVLLAETQADIMLMDTHITLTLFGAVFILVYIMQRMLRHVSTSAGQKMPCVSCCAITMFAFVLVGELSGRLMFYMLYSGAGL